MQNASPRSRAKLASEISPKKAQWFWLNRIQKNSINIVEGTGGCGKTTILCALTAAVTSPGKYFPDYRNHTAQKVIWLSPEADASCEMVPSLMAVGANLEMVHLISQSLAMDSPELATEVETIRPALLIIDPFSACCNDDPNKATTARKNTNALTQLCEKYGVTVIMVRHLSKSRGMGNADTAGLYSGEWAAAARSVLLVGYSVEDKDLRAVIHTKCNNGPIMPGLGFFIEGVDEEFGGKKVQWTGEAEIDEKDILFQPHMQPKRSQKVDGGGEKQRLAIEVLTQLLSDGPKTTQQLNDAMDQAMIAPATFQRARKVMNLQKEAIGQRGTPDQGFLWGFDDQINGGAVDDTDRKSGFGIFPEELDCGKGPVC